MNRTIERTTYYHIAYSNHITGERGILPVRFTNHKRAESHARALNKNKGAFTHWVERDEP